MQIGEYKCTSPFATAGSGNARWCVAEKNETQYFLKQFLAPVQPVQTTQQPTKQVVLRRKKCAAFETNKLKLYEALKRVPSANIVHVDDFFVHEGHYYAASEYLGLSYQTFETFQPTQMQTKLKLLLSVSECLQALHACGVVHADLKPEHIIIENHQDTLRARLIDFDSGFLQTAPPDAQSGMEVDPVYMSPEAYQLITGKTVSLSNKIDIFTFGILMYQLLSGELPVIDKTQYTYLYAAVLDGGNVTLSQKLSGRQQAMIHKMLRKSPSLRPGDGAVSKRLNEMLL